MNYVNAFGLLLAALRGLHCKPQKKRPVVIEITTGL